MSTITESEAAPTHLLAGRQLLRQIRPSHQAAAAHRRRHRLPVDRWPEVVQVRGGRDHPVHRQFAVHARPRRVQGPHECRGRTQRDQPGLAPASATYPVSIFIGVCIVTIALLVLAHYLHPAIGMQGALGVIGFSFVSLSFLATTPEVWVTAPAQGAADADIGFPYLSVRGRLVIKDCIQMGAGFVLLVDSARTYLARIGHPYRAA